MSTNHNSYVNEFGVFMFYHETSGKWLIASSQDADTTNCLYLHDDTTPDSKTPPDCGWVCVNGLAPAPEFADCSVQTSSSSSSSSSSTTGGGVTSSSSSSSSSTTGGGTGGTSSSSSLSSSSISSSSSSFSQLPTTLWVYHHGCFENGRASCVYCSEMGSFPSSEPTVVTLSGGYISGGLVYGTWSGSRGPYSVTITANGGSCALQFSGSGFGTGFTGSTLVGTYSGECYGAGQTAHVQYPNSSSSSGESSSSSTDCESAYQECLTAASNCNSYCEQLQWGGDCYSCYNDYSCFSNCDLIEDETERNDCYNACYEQQNTCYSACMANVSVLYANCVAYCSSTFTCDADKTECEGN